MRWPLTGREFAGTGVPLGCAEAGLCWSDRCVAAADYAVNGVVELGVSCSVAVSSLPCI